MFYASLNFVGYYVRYVGEINMRRGFLDKRGCIDATFKLKYEKEQEVTKSVYPKYLEVGEHPQISNRGRLPLI